MLHVDFCVKIWACKRNHHTIWSKKTCERLEWCTNFDSIFFHMVWLVREWFSVQNLASLSATQSNLYYTSFRVELKHRPLPFYELQEAVCRCLHLVAFLCFSMLFGSASFMYIMKHKGSIFIARHVTWDWVQPPGHRTGVSKAFFPSFVSTSASISFANVSIGSQGMPRDAKGPMISCISML